MIKIVFATLVLLMITSCAVVKPYEQIFINDPDMDVSVKTIETFEINFHTYREGSSGVNGKKVGGGCGCN